MVVKEFVFSEPLPVQAEMNRNRHRIRNIDATFLDRPHGHPRRNLPSQFTEPAVMRGSAIPDKRTAKLRTQTKTYRPQSPKLRARPRSALERMPNFSSHLNNSSEISHDASSLAAAAAPTYAAAASTRVAFDPRGVMIATAHDRCLESVGRPRQPPPPLTPTPATPDAAPSTEAMEGKLNGSKLAPTEPADADHPPVGPGLHSLLEAAIGHPFNDVLVPTGILALFDTMEEDLDQHDERIRQRTAAQKAKLDHSPSPKKKQRPQSAMARPMSAASIRGLPLRAAANAANQQTPAAVRQRPQSALARSSGNSFTTPAGRPMSATERRIRKDATTPSLNRTSDPTAWADSAALASAQQQDTVACSSFVGKKIGGLRVGGGFQMGRPYSALRSRSRLM